MWELWGAGFSSVSREALLENGLPLTLQQDFLNSIEKVWDEPVDIMLGNHPFHNDTYQKYERLVAGEEDAFVDPGEWHRFLSELKQKYQEFFKEKSPDQVKENVRGKPDAFLLWKNGSTRGKKGGEKV